MKKLVVFAALAALVWACGSSGQEQTSTSGNQMAAVEKPAVDGGKVYKQYCVTCHGLYGDMGGSGAFDLSVSELSVEERINVITNGRNTMTPFGALLSEEKIKAVAEYTLTLKKEG